MCWVLIDASRKDRPLISWDYAARLYERVAKGNGDNVNNSATRSSVVRARGGTAARADAGSVIPRLDVAAGPNPAESTLRFALSRAVSSL
jgi:hypothetical protein